MTKSLQELQDYYINQGLVGARLRQAIEEDGEYQKLLEERKAKLLTKSKLPKQETDKYVLATDTDYLILDKIRSLEKQDLSKSDEEMVRFIRTQLELDWRSPVVVKLD